MNNSNDLYPKTTISQQSLLIEAGNGKYLLSEPVGKEDMYALMLSMIEEHFVREAEIVSPGMLRQYLQVKLARKEYEIFGLIYLDNSHNVISYEEMFRGSVDSCSIPIREVIKSSLSLNCSSLICFHNHPSGSNVPSMADKEFTDRLVKALDLVSIRLIDHLIVAGTSTVSFAEEGLL